jgi:hypothetical protein
VVPNQFPDRRSHVRYEIVGDLWATITAAQSMPVVNLGEGGALLEAADPLLIGSMQHLRLRFGTHAVDVAGNVKHVRRSPSRPDRYLVGIEFADPSAAALQAIEAALHEHGGSV